MTESTRACEALYMKHRQGQKDKGEGHKVTRRSSIKTSKISRKRHSIVERHLLIGNPSARGNGGVRFLTGSSEIAVFVHAQ